MNASRNKRSNAGSLAAVLFAIVILIVVAIGALAVDFSHMTAVQADLQNAVDAAARAGAQDLTSNFNEVQTSAEAVAADHIVDGRRVSNSSKETTVIVNIVPPTDPDPGTCQVIATMVVHHMLAPIFGRFTDTCRASATAGSNGTITQLMADSAFPLVVSIDHSSNYSSMLPHYYKLHSGPTLADIFLGGTPAWATPPSGSPSSGSSGSSGHGSSSSNPTFPPLYVAQIGDSVTFYINSQQYKNSAWTSLTVKNTNANWLTSAINQSLGLATVQPGYIPSCKIGDTIYLDNGVAGQKRLADGDANAALLSKEMIVLPVMSGDPPYNQTTTVVGFIAVKPLSVEINQQGGMVESFTCKVIKAITRGKDGAMQSGNQTWDTALNLWSPGAAKILSN